MNQRRVKYAVNTKGFSQFELLLTLAILLLLCSTAVPSIQGFLQGFLFKQEITQIAEDIREVQHHAVTNTLGCRIDFMTQTPNYYIFYGNTLIQTRIFANTLHYVNGFIQLSSNQLSFYGTGGPSVAGTLRLRDDFGHSASILIYLGSGQVVVTYY